MSLVAHLLADAVDKGGPGSGPHPGQSSKQTVTAEKPSKTAYYHGSAAHKDFAQAHRDMAAKLKASGDKAGASNHMKAAQAHETASRSHDAYTGEALAREVHAGNASYSANRGNASSKFNS